MKYLTAALLASFLSLGYFLSEILSREIFNHVPKEQK